MDDWDLPVRCRAVISVVSARSFPRKTMIALSFSDITRRLATWTFPDGIDGVVGIATGGVVPASLVAMRLGVELKMIALNYRDEANEPRFPKPQLMSVVPNLGSWRRVLLVDDVYVSGKSWHAARDMLPMNIDVLPFVMKGKVEFALIRDIDGCVQWPWKIY
jgi:xanthine phosphoribosyltransferase